MSAARNDPPRKVIIDTDCGIDDAMALLLALASPELSVVGISTVAGNVDVDTVTSNVLFILELAGREANVHRGAERALLGEGFTPSAFHGPTGLGPLTAPPARASPRDAVQWIIETVLASPGEIDIIALGPATNIALAIATERRVAAAVRRVIYMGGATLTYGNVGPISTFNIAADPEASSILLRSGVSSLVQIGQDVTRGVRMTGGDEQRLLTSDSDVCHLVHKLGGHLRDMSARMEPEQSGYPINDVVATAFAIDPSLFDGRVVDVAVALSDPLTRGATVADYRPGATATDQSSGSAQRRSQNCYVCLSADRDGIVDLFINRIATAFPRRTARVAPSTVLNA